jgi:hypothetical protein
VGWAFFTNARYKQPPNRANTLDVFFAITGQKKIELNEFAKFPLITSPNQDKKGDSVCRGYYFPRNILGSGDEVRIAYRTRDISKLAKLISIQRLK